MPIVTPNWDLPTPALTDPYNLVGDLATFASAVDDALTETGNVFRGTATERIAFASSAMNGMLWQDTDGIKMIWRRDSSVAGNWTPAVLRWRGTTAQMNAFTQAPDGFEWFNTSTSIDHVKVGGAWIGGSGTLPLSLGTGTLTWKAHGQLVEVSWVGTGSYPTGASTLSNALIPAAYRPSGAVRGSAALNARAQASLYVTSGGQVGIINSTDGTRTGGEGIAMYYR